MFSSGPARVLCVFGVTHSQHTPDLPDIHGSAIHNREIFTKTNFQDMGVSKEPGIAAERDPHVHREMSRKLVPAFSARAVAAQEPVVQGHIEEFMRQIARKTASGEDINVGEASH